jgi:hypothetical protein
VVERAAPANARTAPEESVVKVRSFVFIGSLRCTGSPSVHQGARKPSSSKG